MGRVLAVHERPGGRRLEVDLHEAAEDLAAGDSVAVDGVCLTAVDPKLPVANFDVITETLSKTTLGQLKQGSHVNLERSLKANGRLDGHMVQGHVDGVAELVEKIDTPAEHKLWFRPDGDLLSFVAPRGSVALAGVSLTAAEVRDDAFAVALIPTTLELTTLGELKVGDTVNIETDILARQVVHWLQRQQS